MQVGGWAGRGHTGGRETSWKAGGGGVLEEGETGLAEGLNVGLREEE